MINFIVLFFFELVYFMFAIKYKIIDLPNDRSSHLKPTIRGGGVLFFIGICIHFFNSGINLPFFFSGLTVISIISFIDDIFDTKYYIRLFFQAISIFLLFGEFTFPFFLVPIIVFLSFAMINAFNFMDGINGMTGFYNLVLFFSFLFINHSCHFIDNNILLITISGLIVFNFFNFRNKAVCFAGDVGSVSLGFISLFILLKLVVSTNNYQYLFLVTIYAIDTIFTIFRRISNNENIFEGHRKHLYQILVNKKKLPHLVVSLFYGILQFFLNLVVIVNVEYPNRFAHLIYLGIIITYVYIYIDLLKPFNKI